MPEDVVEAPEIGLGPSTERPESRTVEPMFSPAPDAPAPSEDDPKPVDGPAETPPFDWKTVNFRTTKPEDVPEQYRDSYEAMQKQFKDVQGTRTRELEDIRRRENDLETQRKELIDLQRQLVTQRPTPQTQQQSAAETKKKATELLNDPDLDPETRKGLQTVKDLAEELIGAASEKIRKEFEDRLKPLNESVSTFTQRETTERQNAFAAQVNEAKEKYGDVDDYTDEICRALGIQIANGQVKATGKPLINRATGKPHTVLSAYELYSGITAQQAQAARAEDKDIRDKAKSGARSPATTASLPPNGKLSERELKAEVNKLFGD